MCIVAIGYKSVGMSAVRVDVPGLFPGLLLNGYSGPKNIGEAFGSL